MTSRSSRKCGRSIHEVFIQSDGVYSSTHCDRVAKCFSWCDVLTKKDMLKNVRFCTEGLFPLPTKSLPVNTEVIWCEKGQGVDYSISLVVLSYTIHLRNKQYQFRNKLEQYSAGTVLNIYALCNVYNTVCALCNVYVQCAPIACMFNMKSSLIVQCVRKIHSFYLKHVFFVQEFIFCFIFTFRCSHSTESDLCLLKCESCRTMVKNINSGHFLSKLERISGCFVSGSSFMSIPIYPYLGTGSAYIR